MPNIVALDIETIPDEAAVAEILKAGPPEPFTAPANWKDQDKINEEIARKRKAWEDNLLKDAGLSSVMGSVASISLWDGSNGGTVTLRDTGMDEKALLQQAFDQFPNIDGVVTFNGLSFDLPFLMFRAARHRIRIPKTFETRRYACWPHCDIRMLLTNWDSYAKGGLQYWCRALDVECPDKDMGIDGSMVYQLVQEGRWEEFEQYSIGGAKSAWNLFRVLYDSGFIPPFESRVKVSATREAA